MRESNPIAFRHVVYSHGMVPAIYSHSSSVQPPVSRSFLTPETTEAAVVSQGGFDPTTISATLCLPHLRITLLGNGACAKEIDVSGPTLRAQRARQGQGPCGFVSEGMGFAHHGYTRSYTSETHGQPKKFTTRVDFRNALVLPTNHLVPPAWSWDYPKK